MQILSSLTMIIGLCWAAFEALFSLYLVVSFIYAHRVQTLACVITFLFSFLASLDLLRITQLLGIPFVVHMPVNWFWWIIRVMVHIIFYGGVFLHVKKYAIKIFLALGYNFDH